MLQKKALHSMRNMQVVDTSSAPQQELPSSLEEVLKEVLKPMTGLSTSSKFEYNPLTDITDAKRIIDLLDAAATNNGDQLAFRSPEEWREELVWKSFGMFKEYKIQYHKVTWKEYREAVLSAATAFVALGLKPMDAVNIKGVNSVEWLVAFLGTIVAGGLPVGLYPTDSPEVLKYKALDSGATFIVVGSAKDVGRYSKFVDQLDGFQKIIYWGTAPAYTGDNFIHWDNFLAEGRDHSRQAKVYADAKKQHPGQAASVVYTSGTTGKAKGVMLSQDNLIWSAETVSNAILTKWPEDGEMRSISYLPLNHVAGQMLDIILPLWSTSKAGQHHTLFFPAKCFLGKTCFKEQMQDARPVVHFGVPLVWDGFKAKLQSALSTFKGAAARKVLGNSFILKQLGLGECLYAASGAGAISPETIAFFQDLGLNILNLYGQSESTGLGTMWTNDDFDTSKVGSIGKPTPYTELRLVDKSSKEVSKQGEIQMRGRHVMLGYLSKPEKTQATISEDGWLATGDLATQDDHLWVHLTGRLKEIMKTHGGEMMAPNAMEAGIAKACNTKDKTLLKQVMVVGDGEMYASVLVTLPEEIVDDMPTGKLAWPATLMPPAFEVKARWTTIADARLTEEWEGYLSSCLTEYNKVAEKRAQRVYKFAILPKDITRGQDDLMTSTFKIKRTGVVAAYKDLIEKCYPAGKDEEKSKAIVKSGVTPCL